MNNAGLQRPPSQPEANPHFLDVLTHQGAFKAGECLAMQLEHSLSSEAIQDARRMDSEDVSQWEWNLIAFLAREYPACFSLLGADQGQRDEFTHGLLQAMCDGRCRLFDHELRLYPVHARTEALPPLNFSFSVSYVNYQWVMSHAYGPHRLELVCESDEIFPKCWLFDAGNPYLIVSDSEDEDLGGETMHRSTLEGRYGCLNRFRLLQDRWEALGHLLFNQPTR